MKTTILTVAMTVVAGLSYAQTFNPYTDAPQATNPEDLTGTSLAAFCTYQPSNPACADAPVVKNNLFNPYCADSECRQFPLRPREGETFARSVEQGPPVAVQTIGLRGSVPSFIWYEPNSGAFWLVVDGVKSPERVCTGVLAPRTNYVALDLDADGQEDLLGHQPSTGRVYREYTRNLNCQ